MLHMQSNILGNILSRLTLIFYYFKKNKKQFLSFIYEIVLSMLKTKLNTVFTLWLYMYC